MLCGIPNARKTTLAVRVGTFAARVFPLSSHVPSFFGSLQGGLGHSTTGPDAWSHAPNALARGEPNVLAIHLAEIRFLTGPESTLPASVHTRGGPPRQARK